MKQLLVLVILATTLLVSANAYIHASKRLLFDLPPNGSCQTQLSKSGCAQFKSCAWHASSSSCYFAADPDTIPLEKITVQTKEETRLRGRKMDLTTPSGGCSTLKLQSTCAYYNGCIWYNHVGCFNLPTPKPTTASPTSEPTAAVTNPTKPTKHPKPTRAPITVSEPTPKPTHQPKAHKGNSKPTKTTPTVGEVCDYPAAGCQTITDSATCILYNGCGWSKNNKKCVPQAGCPKTAPPQTTTPPSMPQQERISIADMCSVPSGGCGSVPLSSCETYNGCMNYEFQCLARDCDPFDCGTRRLAFDFAQTLLPRCTGEIPALSGGSNCMIELQDVFDGLELNAKCGYVFNTGPDPTGSSAVDRIPLRKYFVATNGNDQTADGSFEYPFQTIQNAVIASRQAVGNPRAVILRAGTYYLTQPISLTSVDSQLTIAPYLEEVVVISGAIPLTGIVWSQYTNNILVADVSQYSQYLGRLTSLYFDGVPATIARQPNANPWTQDLYTKGNTGYIQSAVNWPHAPSVPASGVVTELGLRPLSTTYNKYSIGYGGNCAIFNPAASYWATADPVAGGGCTFQVPNGIQFSPSSFAGISTTQFAHPEDAYVHAYHPYYWANWIFSVASQSDDTLTFNEGGFQEARGDCGVGGSQWFIDNLFELLDAPNEFFLDPRSFQLYYRPNTTSVNPNDIPTAYATVSSRLIEVIGDSTTPVTDVLIAGIQFEMTYATHMEDHEVPSGGDWSITRNGAIYIEGVENVVVEGNSFLYMGGNGVFVSNYAQDVRVVGNRFKWLGGSAVLAVGDPRYYASDPWNLMDPNHPVGTVIYGNIASEMGGIVKQSGGFFQALSRSSTIQHNVIFNSERSAVNFNDGFGGDNLIELNLLFNTVRSTMDHGPFNSWDRQAFVQSHPGSNFQPTSEPMMSFVTQNFLLCTYGGTKGIDHDDGSTWWYNSQNLIVYGYQKLKGRNQESFDNLVLYPQDYTVFLSEPIGVVSSELLWHDNTMVTVSGTQPYGFGSPDTCQRNVFQADTNTMYIGGPFWAICLRAATEDWPTWKAGGQDTESIEKSFLPSTDTTLIWSYNVLGLDSSVVN